MCRKGFALVKTDNIHSISNPAQYKQNIRF